MTAILDSRQEHAGMTIVMFFYYSLFTFHFSLGFNVLSTINHELFSLSSDLRILIE
jgi:hypothetical protein